MEIKFNCKECGQSATILYNNRVKPRQTFTTVFTMLKQQLCSSCIHERERQIREIMQHREGYSFVAIDEFNQSASQTPSEDK